MARYAELRWDYTGLVAATDPFGGHYTVLPPVWAAAHTTQFTAPGWRMLPVGRGSGWLQKGGTYVGYVGPAGELTVSGGAIGDGEWWCYWRWRVVLLLATVSGGDIGDGE